MGFVQGVQSQRVAAVVKHFCCNNREANRNWYMSNVSERALREIYLPGFKAAIQQGDAWGVMTAANGINGEYAGANKPLITGFLRDDLGFKGIVLTDFNQARGTLPSARPASISGCRGEENSNDQNCQSAPAVVSGSTTC